MTAVSRVKLTIETDDGEAFTLVADKPSPQGGNARFLGQQLNHGLAALTGRAHAVLATGHPKQIWPDDERG